MATTEEYKNGGSASYAFSIERIKDEDIKVSVDGTDLTYTATNPPAQTTEYTVNGSNVIFKQASVSGSTTGGVRIYRETALENADSATFVAGSSIRAADLNANHRLVRFAAQEQNQKIVTDDIKDSQITSAKILNNTIVDADIASNAEIEVYKLKDGAANQVLITQTDGTTVGWSSALNLPTTLQVQGNTFLDTATNVSGDFTIFNSGTQKFKVFNTTGNTEIAGTLTVTGNVSNTGGATCNNVQVGVTAGNEIDTSSGSLTLDSASGNIILDDNVRVTGTFTVDGLTTYPANVVVTGSQLKIQADNSEFAVNNGSGVTKFKVDSDNGNTLIQGTATIADIDGAAVVTSGTSTSDTKFYSAKRSDELYYRKGTADDIEESGVPWSGNDSTIATTAAIDARIVDIVDDVGGFAPLVDEGEIPQLHPEYVNKDTADRVGTILSIGNLTKTYTPSNGTVTILASDLSNHSVNATITDCGTTVLSAGFGVLVETKAQTDSQYAAGPSFKFHRLVPKATEVTTVAGKATEITTVHTNITNVNTVATNISNINAVAADATDIGAVAAKATEIGRLGTADAVADMAILGTADVVADMAILGTNDVVADMNTLATADVVADMNTLATADIVSDMNALATTDNITAMDTCRDNISSITNCSTNISSVNTFGDQYQVAANNPSTDGGGNTLAAGDLYFNTSANELKVYNGSSWQGGVTAAGSFATTTGNTFTGDNTYNDGVKAVFGAGSDLEIMHNDSQGWSRILNQQGDLYINNLGSNADDLFIQAQDDILIRPQAGENGIKVIGNGGVQLYYDGGTNPKFETTASGATVTGSLICDGLNLGDNELIQIGADNDLRLYHDSGENFVGSLTSSNLNFFTNNTNRWMVQNNNGHLRPFADSTYDIGTTGIRVRNVYADTYYGDGTNLTGIDTDLVNDSSPQLGGDLDLNGSKIAVGDGGPNANQEHIRFGDDGDLRIYHDSNNSYINDTGAGLLKILTSGLEVKNAADNSYAAFFGTSGASELYFSGNKKFETTDTGVSVTGHVAIADNNQVRFGNSNDLVIQHNTNENYIQSNSGHIYIRCNVDDDEGDNIYLQPKSGDNSAVFVHDGEVSLFYANNKKFETTNTGTSITGSLGINTTSPAVLIDARTTSGGSIQVQNTSSNIGVLGINVGAAENFIYSKGDGATAKRDLTFMLGTSKAARFDTNLHFRPESDSTHDLGLTGTRWRNVYADTLHGGKARITDDGSDSPLLSVRADDSNPWGLVVGNDSADTDGGLRVYQNNNRDVYVQSYAGSGAGSTFNNTYFQHSASSAYNPITFTSGQQVEIRMNGDVVPRITTDASSAQYASIKISGSNGSNTAYGGVSINNTINLLGHLSDGIFGIYDQHSSKWVMWYDDGDGTYLYHDNKWHIRTLSVGAGINSNGNATELKIYSNNGNIRGSLYGDNSNNFGLLDNGGNWHIKFDSGRDAHFYGHANPASDNTYDLGSSSKRWRNVYTTDLHLSNEGSSNDVDSTWGDWTIQEGESDLFLKNNRSGKKYKFNLTEVS